jgi:hypothetical protein
MGYTWTLDCTPDWTRIPANKTATNTPSEQDGEDSNTKRDGD